MKVEATEVDGRKVYSVRSFNQGVATWLNRLPTLWVEGEITELRRQDRWASVFFTLKDPEDGACLAAQMPRGQFDALQLGLGDGERVHVFGRPELYEQRGELRLKVMTIERFGLGAHLAALERLKSKLAAEGLFAAGRKQTLPRFPRLIGLVTGNDAAAKKDVVTHIVQRFPPANILIAETYVQGPRAPTAIAAAIGALCERGADVIVLARGGGSFEDLLPFSDERVVRAVAECNVPIVSAVGHEQDTPLCDLAADVRASTPTAAARLVVPDIEELRARLERTRTGLHRGARTAAERYTQRLERAHERLRRAPLLAIERKRARIDTVHARLGALSPTATLERGYAIVRRGEDVVRTTQQIDTGDDVSIRVADGAFGATVA
ncbi:MAG: exodeoxyribonuclease VII large subunit [Actinobacteria bacterium]|nr:exodeoxyribonuclease VII large subunit [Actinomycetota bacterium]